jgi:diguanylate cyclase (GGDEF)-like protein/PAS domain S-box-containing protein
MRDIHFTFELPYLPSQFLVNKQHKEEANHSQLYSESMLLQHLMNSTSDLIFYKNKEGRYVACNRAFEQFTGKPAAELFLRTDQEVFTDDKIELFTYGDQALFNTGLAQIYTRCVIGDEEDIKFLEIVKTPIVEQEQLQGLIAIARNVTEHYCTETALRYSQMMLSLVMDNIPQAIFWQSQQGIFLGCNRNFIQFIGLDSAQKVIGKKESELRLIYPRLIPFLEALQQSVMDISEQQPRQVITFAHPNHNKNCWLELSYVQLINEENKELVRLICFEDITARRHSEERLRHISKALENNTEAVLITDEKTRILAINRAFSNITGYTEAEALNRTPRELVFSGKHEAEFYQNMWHSIHSVGHWEGEILNRRKNGEIYPEWLHISVIKDEQNQKITHYLAIFSDITQRKKAEAQLEYLAHYDELTGLPNRLFFHKLLSKLIERHRLTQMILGVMLVDLDRFKDVNDTWGHDTGDVLLQAVTKRLKACIGEGQLIARLGGDDFIICLEHIGQLESVTAQAQMILDAMLPPFFLNDHEVFVTSSIGIALFPNDGEDANTLLKNADAAMYSAKATGKNTYALFTQKMNTEARRRVTLESQLRHALERDEFKLYYQPQMHLMSGIITGAEVLIRWEHPEQGLILPHLFIPLAEETGLVSQIGEWVLFHACEQHRQWCRQGLPILRLAVNLSSRQFRDQNFLERIFTVIENTKMDPTLLELELTESMLMQDAAYANRLLCALKENHIQIAIDDFGTGYSSLSYLKRFPIHRLKVDQSFIREIPSNKDDMAITRAIVALAHSLHLQVTAEGVETRAQMAFLKSLKCEEIQGYLISRPLPADQFISFIQQE